MALKRVRVLDCGAGNAGSVLNMVKYVGGAAELVSEPEDVRMVDCLIIPGVGHFGEVMKRLQEGGWVEPLNEARGRGCWVLGICLGMQILTKFSEEGERQGLGWVDLTTRKFDELGIDGRRRRVPHMGWNAVEFRDGNFGDANRFYFVHSYYVDGLDSPACWAVTNYEGVEFVSAIRSGRVLGVQFHPEKSHRHGMALMRYFLKLSQAN
ncbi:MAG: imidazole glycerol phosphate synthase subunit HisH [Verrucomicrobiales bacterium]|nr:imidazole glycerol phosphate synthase subunit HisH [Verrucomicrobiales bacterium]